MFINFSNHPSNKWLDAQKEASYVYGGIVDIPFPQVDPNAGESEINELAHQYLEEIKDYSPEAVLVAGELSLCFKVANALLKEGITVLCPCSERFMVERVGPNGIVIKAAEYKFIRYRKYEEIE